MADCFIGQITLFAYDRAPENWAKCNGALLSIQHNEALFSLLGAKFGGDGNVNFALPKLDSPAPDLDYYIAFQGEYPWHS